MQSEPASDSQRSGSLSWIWELVGWMLVVAVVSQPFAAVFGEDLGLLLGIVATAGGAFWWSRHKKQQRAAARVEQVAAVERARMAARAEVRRLAEQRPQPRLFKTAAEAELLAAEWMRYFGFHDAITTQPGPDGGLDVTSADAVAQVKAQAVAVGRPIVQQTFGAAVADKKQAFVFALGGYTADAQSWATANDVALFEFAFDGSVTPVNVPARLILAEADARPPSTGAGSQP